MNSEIIPKARRGRGRPRKTNSNLPNVAKGAATLKQAPSYTPKRKQLLDPSSDEIQVIGFNGFEPSQAKKPKSEDLSDPNLSKRSLPHRAARFTESYGGTSPDVVIISDEEQGGSESESDSDYGPIPSPVIVVKSKEELEQYEENIQSLKKILCDEEMKLVLLKKLQDSQKSKDHRPESNSSPLPTSGQPSSKPSSTVTLKSGMQIQPLPSKQLISNSNKLISSKKEMKFESTSHFNKAAPKATSNSSVSTSVKQSAVKAELDDSVPSVSSSSAEKINASHLQQYPLLKNLSAQITITAVPPVGSPAPTNHSQPATVSNLSKNVPIAPAPTKEEKGESLSQRQAAAKLALRKQLEKTLLQIPLPKAPPLKINFFPNANSIEFLCLLGLDFVVDFLTKTKKSTHTTTPLTCAQCSTDFTCAWKWKEVNKNGVKSYDAFCEACINSNIRKSLKAQHTNSLKAAFLKALHQEKEIDKLTHIDKLPSKSHSPSPRETHRSHLPSPSPAHQNSSVSVHPLPKHGAPVPYIPKAAPNLTHAAALAQMTKLSPQYQQLLQIQAQHLFATGVPLHPSMLSTFMSPSPNLNRGKSSVANDLRRQYRSDRVQSPSIPHSSSSWKA